MAEIIHFVPRAELEAEQNLKGFVGVCRNQLTVFGHDLDFNANVWDVTTALAIKNTKRQSLIFSTWKTVNDKQWTAMSEPFLSFAKAYMRYQHAQRPTQAVAQRISALRAIEAALSENGGPSDPILITAQILNRASQLCIGKFSRGVAYRTCGQMELLNEFMIRNRLLTAPSRWRNPAVRPQDTTRVGADFDKRRGEKMPSPTALAALADIFNNANSHRGVLVSSIAAILCAAPDRISEVLYLEENCEVSQVLPARIKDAYGLRWRPAKGAEPMVKWILPSMVDVVKAAVAKVRTITAPARAIAKWYETHPAEIYLPPHLEDLRSREWLTLTEAMEIVFAGPVDPSTPRNWCARNNVHVTTGRGEQARCRFAEIQAAVLSALPRGFPRVQGGHGLRYGDALFVVQRNLLSRVRATYRGVIQLVDHADVGNALSARRFGGVYSIFSEHGFKEPDGSPIHVTTHQFRHYLNTLAQTGGLSQLDIAKWSGRKDVKQNRAYDHLSDRDVLSMVRTAVGDPERTIGPLARLNATVLTRRDEFARLKVPAAHTTEFGYCIHDFSMLPCQLHRDCMNCTEQVCIKGDAAREANIRRLRNETRQLLAEAVAAESEKNYGANRWVAHQRQTLARLDELCAIFDDPSIPPGTVIQPLKAAPASRLDQAAGTRTLGTRSPHGRGALSRAPRHLSAPKAATHDGVDT